MQINRINNYNPKFGTKINGNLESVINTLAEKGYPKLEQCHLDVLKSIKNDGLKGTKLCLNYGFMRGPRVDLESPIMEKSNDLISEILTNIEKSYHTADSFIKNATVEAGIAALHLHTALVGNLDDNQDFAIAGIDVSRFDDRYTYDEKMLGLTKLKISPEKLLWSLKPGENNLSKLIVEYHKNLEKAYIRAKNAYENYISISTSN